MRSRRNFGQVTHQRHILGRSVEFVSRDNRTNRFTARGVVFRDIRLLVQAALDNFRGVFEILAQFVFGEVKNFQFYVLAEVGFIHQRFQATPDGFHFLELIIVHHFIELTANLEVQFGDVMVE